MFRGKPMSTTQPNYTANPNLQYLQKNNGLRRTISNGSNSLKRGNGGSMRAMRRKMSTKKKQKRDIEQMVTLGEAYLIIHLCAGEVVVRGLTEPEIFKPVRIRDGANEVRYLINCLLRDNRAEFEDELKFQDIHNIVAGIRWALRNCTTIIIPYDYYEQFVRYEQGKLNN
ncbi:hypothetical protein RirG_093450 [Rhizophagus irregularis DAOM 197198w]|uniref:Rho-GAP domain-containing protein n=1 Tax=Rhizophagus irregularis (strain DAOM 197198w) TaxID=1432141 RepID=A0A015KQ90_RHIIW|nr:hypothetical protein RirG_093450 [Rhizophagus irregularis DAOM 197198w]